MCEGEGDGVGGCFFVQELTSRHPYLMYAAAVSRCRSNSTDVATIKKFNILLDAGMLL